MSIGHHLGRRIFADRRRHRLLRRVPSERERSCPACGGDGIIREDSHDGSGRTSVWRTCPVCDRGDQA
ncbi:hypothetical protein FOE78_19495 [Microlunatus elymi]|uniref:Uncharacterized protein n=1 Tax=Microlunatus elymi TaxID=2596828 RepID=A0A516Q338_9ACTN|nr:hypothetical protein [Microlunatus elymi]QDP97802.1 hypothetical protein FOE78_19495 [Microlunatus elymi]